MSYILHCFPHYELVEILNKTGIDWWDRRSTLNLCLEQKVRLNNGETNIIRQVNVCVKDTTYRPFCSTERGLAKKSVEEMGDFKIGGRCIETIKYEDDLVLPSKKKK